MLCDGKPVRTLRCRRTRRRKRAKSNTAMTTAMAPHAMPAIFPADDEARWDGDGVPLGRNPVEVALATGEGSAEGLLDVEDMESAEKG